MCAVTGMPEGFQNGSSISYWAKSATSQNGARAGAVVSCHLPGEAVEQREVSGQGDGRPGGAPGCAQV